MRNAVHAEWTKLRTLPSTPWLLLGIVALTVLTAAAATLPVTTEHCPPAGCFEDTTRLSLSGVRVSQVAVVVLAALIVGNEYGTGMISLTFAATPVRRTVLAAKALVLVAVVSVPAVLGVLGSLAAGDVILTGNGFDGLGPVWRPGIGTVLYLVLVALLTLGVTAVVRDTAGAITTMLLILVAAPVIGGLVTDPHWRERIAEFTPMPAGLAIQATVGLDTLPIGPWAGLGVLTAYAGVALLVGGVMLAVRDV
ncbi:MAG: ABC transporter permease [Streptosporangiaceae bacterium]